ncbi:MAG: hypothetical protein KHX84_25845, partial [Enterocloster asparagiformis]|nr:hypothetical protein [Enterocloster asparagiformis]
VCALAALTVRKTKLAGKNPIDEVDFKWIFARICEGTEQIRWWKQRVHSCQSRVDSAWALFEI